ncbi:hypothetical protein Aple_031320 [Acrocarpospora pleiomorpha]|uniref:Uncharacterized protein n=1 Tax=Acrocarpospora pleiomorpha TaxID=90975 RepID=A0A5M3XHP9_9ACTN|nr:hypothetical protein Aple_031320 [Acrocarpospora pleiomorpha]
MSAAAVSVRPDALCDGGAPVADVAGVPEAAVEAAGAESAWMESESGVGWPVVGWPVASCAEWSVGRDSARTRTSNSVVTFLVSSADSASAWRTRSGRSSSLPLGLA